MKTSLATLRQFGQAVRAEPTARQLIIRFTQEPDDAWTVVTADRRRTSGFADITDAVAFARRSCDAAPATLWLEFDGLVVIVPQNRGWTRPLIGERTPRS